MKNTLSDLNNHLFLQLERLNEEGLTQEQLSFESERAKSMSMIARAIVDNAQLVLDSHVQMGDIPQNMVLPKFIG